MILDDENLKALEKGAYDTDSRDLIADLLETVRHREHEFFDFCFKQGALVSATLESNQSLHAENKALRKELKNAKETLTFYALRSNYEARTKQGLLKIVADSGKRARVALGGKDGDDD